MSGALRRDEVVDARRGGHAGRWIDARPFESPIVMWWNFVARTTDEIDEARAAWMGEPGRFGATGSPLRRIEAPETPWRR